MNKIIKKADLIFIFLMFMVGLVIMGCYYFRQKRGSSVVVEVNGVIVGEYDLNVDQELIISGYMDGYNLLSIKDGQASIEEADCPDHLCMNMGKISKVNESIICLPNKVVITVVKGQEAEFDVIAK